MSNAAKLKEQARALEFKGQYESALDRYLQLVQTSASDGADAGLWNRIGDLHLRLGDRSRAIEAYQRAVDLYVEAELSNNAIALCNKILRTDPERTSVYRKLGEISASQGYMVDARRSFLRYAEKLRAAGETAAAFVALEEFADLVPRDTEVRRILADQLLAHGHHDEAVVQLGVMWQELRRQGRLDQAEAVRQEISVLQPDAELEAQAVDGTREPASRSDFGVLPTLQALPRPEAAPAPAPAEDLPLVPNAPPESEESEPGIIAPLEGLEPTHAAYGAEDLPAPAEPPPAEEPPEIAVPDEEGPDSALPLLALEEEPPPEEPPAEESLPETTPWTAPEQPPADPLERLRARVDADPDDVDARVELFRALKAQGFHDEAADVAGETHRRMAAQGRFREAGALVSGLLELRPTSLPLLQAQVEYAFRSGDQEQLTHAYRALARHLRSSGDAAKARAVYQRVLDLDPDDAEARAAVAPPARQPEQGYVDLGSLVLDTPATGAPHSTRFTVAAAAPTGDEERDFAEMLAIFRDKVAEHIDAKDSASHYDLGLAFKEMGLYDEAIQQFQTALRAGARPLSTLEVLGECWVSSGREKTGAQVLRRVTQMRGATDAEMVGVLYWLGRAEEALGEPARARDAYHRVLAVAPRFRDVASRLAAVRTA